MLLSEFIRHGISELENLYPSPEARGMVLMLCESRLGVKSYTHIIEPSYEILSGSHSLLDDDMRRLCNGEPIQYVLGSTEFCGRSFRLCPDVLIPRPETELLVMEAEKAMGEGAAEVLDLCTGSGCIAWSVLLDRPGSRVVAVDVSEPALVVARRQFPGKSPVFIQSDILDTEQEFDQGMFDVIVSNPPYVMEKEKSRMRSNVLDFEPGIALFVPDDDPLVFYRAIAGWGRRFLKEGGTGLVEINEQLGCETAGVFVSAGYKDLEIIPDIYGKSRIVKFRK